MARGKHSTALFEVITANRHADRKAPPPAAALRTPKWWFKGRPKAGAPAATSPALGGGFGAISAKPKLKAPPAPVAREEEFDPTANVSAASLRQVDREPLVSAPSPETIIPNVVVPEPFAQPPIVQESVEAEPTVVERAFFGRPTPLTRQGLAAEPESFEAAADQVNDRAVEPAAAPRPTSSSRPAVALLKQLSGRGMRWVADSDRQEVTLTLRYTTAIVAAFAVVVVISLAYLIGRHYGEKAALAAASQDGQEEQQPDAPAAPSAATVSTAEVKKGPVQATVLDVGGHAKPAAARFEASKPPALTSGAAVSSGGGDRDYEDAPLSADGVATRTINRNYVIVHSFETRASAFQARDFLIQNGIPCTVERSLPQTTYVGWYTVLGTRGFPKSFLNSKPYLDYKSRIEELGKTFPGHTAFLTFQPRGYRWTGK